MQAAQIAGTHDAVLAAGHDLTVGTADNTHTEGHSLAVNTYGAQRSGLHGMFGVAKATQTASETDTTPTGSLIGSTDGAVTLSAGQDVHVTGSDVLSQTGTAIVGQNVTIEAAVGTADSHQSQSLHTGGIMAGLTGGAATAAEQAYASGQRTGQVSDKRLKALYAAQAAYGARDAYKGGSADVGGAGSGGGAQGAANSSGISLRIGIGASSASAHSDTHDDIAYASHIQSAGDVTIAATNGDLNVIGSQVSGDNVALAASHDLNLLSQAEQHTQKDSSANASGEVGVSIGSTTGIYVSAAGGLSRAHGNGETHTDSVISASDTLSLISGNDTTIQGAQARGNAVLADIGGNLNLASEQDTNDYASKNAQGGITLVYGFSGGGVGVSGNLAYGHMDNDYASVTQVSGIAVGNGGYQLHVGDNTDLKGAVIASTADPSRNYLSTGSLSYQNIDNTASYDTFGFAVAGSYNSQAKGEQKIDMSGTGPQVPAHGSRNSETQSAVAQGTLDIRDGSTSDISRNPTWSGGQVNAYNQQQIADKQELANTFVSTANTVTNAIYDQRERGYNAQIQDKLDQARAAEAGGDMAAGQALRREAFELTQQRNNPSLSQVTVKTTEALAGSLLSGSPSPGYVGQVGALDYIGNAWANAGKGFNETQAVKVTCVNSETQCQNGDGGFQLDKTASPMERLQDLESHGYVVEFVDQIPTGATNFTTNGILNDLARASQVMVGYVQDDPSQHNTSYYLQYNQTYGGVSDLMQAGWDKFVAPLYGEYSATTNALAAAIMQNPGSYALYNTNLYGHSWGSITTRNVENILASNSYQNAGMRVEVFGPAVAPRDIVVPLEAITGKMLTGKDGLADAGQIAYYSKYDDPVATFVGGTSSRYPYLDVTSASYLSGASQGSAWDALKGLGAVFGGTINPHSCYKNDCLGSNQNWTTDDSRDYGLSRQISKRSQNAITPPGEKQ